MPLILFSIFLSFMTTSQFATAAPVNSVHTDRKVVALTFDDGPSATFTPIILDLLRKDHVKATFFVIGSRVEKFPDLVNEEFREHHEIANHSFQHQIMTGLSSDKVYDELLHTQRAIEIVTQSKQPLMFRPPRGRVSKTVLQVAEQNHFQIVMWSLETRDWANPGAQKIVKKVLSQVKSGDIILMHDQGGDRTQTVNALKQIIPVLKDRGYDFVTVSELLNGESV